MKLFSTGVGIDVSDHHVRVAWSSHQGVPKGLYELVLPTGYVVDDKVEKPQGLNKQLLKLLNESALANVDANAVLLVPESRVFSTHFEISGKLSPEVEQAEALKMGQTEIPIPFRDAYVFVRKGAKTKKKNAVNMNVLAVQKDIMEQYKKAFHDAHTPFVAIESGGKGLYRLFERFGDDKLQVEADQDILIIVDIGLRWTNITVYDKIGAAIFSRSFALRDLSANAEGPHKLTDEQVGVICTNLVQTVDFFKDSGSRIQLVLFAGVEGAQEHLVKSCQKNLKDQKVLRMGEVVRVPNVSPEDVHTYGAAIGAAIRGARPGHYKKDNNFFTI